MKYLKLFHFFLVISFLISFTLPVNAQSEIPQLPVYIVQSGDTLNLIALKFNVSAEDIVAVNNLSDPNMLQMNTQLVIPGIEGAKGYLKFEPVKLGETPLQIARYYDLNLSSLYKLNRITSPSEFFLGANVILVFDEAQNTDAMELKLAPSESILESAILNNYNPWEITERNQIKYIWEIIPNEQFIIHSNGQTTDYQLIEFNKLPLVQGKTSSIIIHKPDANATGSLDGMEIAFYDQGEFSSAIFGAHAMKEPGLYPFHLSFESEPGKIINIDQLILLQSGFYPNDPVLSVDPITLDRSVTQPEEDLIISLILLRTNEKYWDSIYQIPVDEPWCIKSWFGNRRAYNDQPYNSFHAGVDYGVCANLNVYAPANGTVIFAGPLSVRGNATIIDHGNGVFSGFWHQLNIFVEVGQKVSTRDLIGEIGSTGRSTGPHLHWEVFANGVQVDPLDWLDTEFP